MSPALALVLVGVLLWVGGLIVKTRFNEHRIGLGLFLGGLASIGLGIASYAIKS